MKNKLALVMMVAILAMTFSCGSKKAQDESATTVADTTAVKADTTVAPADTTKAK